jgi:hypothetical protein
MKIKNCLDSSKIKQEESCKFDAPNTHTLPLAFLAWHKLFNEKLTGLWVLHGI